MCAFSRLLVRTVSVTRLSVTFMQSNIAKSPCLQYRTSKKKVENTAIIVLLYCLKLVLFLVFSLLYFLCRGPFTRSQLCLQLTHSWNKPSNSIFVFTFVNDYDWHDFDRSSLLHTSDVSASAIAIATQKNLV